MKRFTAQKENQDQPRNIAIAKAGVKDRKWSKTDAFLTEVRKDL